MDLWVVTKLAIGLMENPGSGQFGNVWSHLNHTETKNVKEVKMPFVIAGVVKSMALSFLGNSGVIEKAIILLAESLAAKSDSKIDDKLVALLKESLEKKS